MTKNKARVKEYEDQINQAVVKNYGRAGTQEEMAVVEGRNEK